MSLLTVALADIRYIDKRLFRVESTTAEEQRTEQTAEKHEFRAGNGVSNEDYSQITCLADEMKRVVTVSGVVG